MGKLFQKHTGRGFSKEEILLTLSEKFPDKTEEYSTMKYDDLFFLTFLNLVEPFLQKDPVFIYNYPPELASLARVVNERAKRFEIYWKGVEIGNAFYELTDHELQYKRFVKEQEERLALGKEVFTVDEEFLAALKRGLPDCSGIAIGLDRLFMIFTGAKDLRFISPYFFPK
jgi:lysyl-tRNA synthetase class 2